LHRALIQHISARQAEHATSAVQDLFAGRVDSQVWPPDITLLSSADAQDLREAVESIEGTRLQPVMYFGS
jgi:hypothetical protein